jgi:hypothetical protein
LFDVANAESGSDKGVINNRRTTLQEKIEMFHSMIQSMLGNLNWDGIEERTVEGGVKGEGEDDCVFCPEDSKIWLPSSFGRNQCLENGWEALAEEELKLRISQANEFLSKIRLGLGGKATLYRTTLRPAKSQDTKTRARQKIAQVTATINKHARSYRHIRNAMIKLDASEATMETFKPLLDTELNVSTDVTEENRYGQRNDQLAWFWRQGPNGASSSHGWMEERKRIV